MDGDAQSPSALKVFWQVFPRSLATRPEKFGSLTMARSPQHSQPTQPVLACRFSLCVVTLNGSNDVSFKYTGDESALAALGGG